MPGAADGPVRGLQLWVNLAKEFKMVEPEYQEHSPEDIVTKEQEGVTVRGKDSRLSITTRPSKKFLTLLDIDTDIGRHWALQQR